MIYDNRIITKMGASSHNSQIISNHVIIHPVEVYTNNVVVNVFLQENTTKIMQIIVCVCVFD